MKLSVYQYSDYRKYVLDLIRSRPLQGRGVRKQLATALGCQMAFITHVLGGEKDFNQEQALKVAQYFNLSAPETEYFIDLLSYNRAGTRDLKRFFEKRLHAKKQEYSDLKNRLQETRSLTPQDHAEYYSHWLYGAVHMASTVPKLQSVEAIAKHFSISEAELEPILSFLASKGLVTRESGSVLPGVSNLYVSKDSPLANQHHAIWRIKSLNDLKTSKTDDFHYSLCFSASQKDWPTIRERLLEAIDDCLKVIRPSKEEKLGLICMDFQGV